MASSMVKREKACLRLRRNGGDHRPRCAGDARDDDEEMRMKLAPNGGTRQYRRARAVGAPASIARALR